MRQWLHCTNLLIRHREPVYSFAKKEVTWRNTSIYTSWSSRFIIRRCHLKHFQFHNSHLRQRRVLHSPLSILSIKAMKSQLPSSSSYPVSSSVDIQDDDPCWGSTAQCDLKHLLSKIKKVNVIRYESSNYIVIQKPPDLRMDGPYRATVHKLLTYWYPPPSIVASSCHEDVDDEKLLETISVLHRHNSSVDNQLRPCHQLDYATSGILCVARNRAAANFAIRQWEDRQVQKTYLAVLEGTLSLGEDNKRINTTASSSSSSSSSSWPTLTSQEMQTKIQQLEDSYRAKKRRQCKKDATKSKATTFQGCQPASSLFQKYKSSIVQKTATSAENGSNSYIKKNKRKRSLLTDLEWEQVWEPVRKIVSDDVVVSMNWKGIGSQQKEWKEAFKEASEIHNGILRNQHNSSEAEKLSASTLPTIFRVEGDPTSVYIYCPLAEVRDEFTMKVPSSIIQDYPQLDSLVSDKSSSDDVELDFKPSLTKCSLVQTATYHTINNNDSSSDDVMIPVTKVKLWPITGRRHQLRVHMALLGHSIFGDKTYSIQSPDEVVTKRRDLTPRMCLHAYSLRLKLLVADDSNESNATSSELGKLMEVTTQDPFLVDDDGKLLLNVL